MSVPDLDKPEYYVAEEHDFMFVFTLASLAVAVLAIPISLSGFSDIGSNIFMILGLVLASLLLIAGAVHTLKVTHGFTRWNHGITPVDRAIGWIVVSIGFLATFWIAIFIVLLIAAARGKRR